MQAGGQQKARRESSWSPGQACRVVRVEQSWLWSSMMNVGDVKHGRKTRGTLPRCAEEVNSSGKVRFLVSVVH